MFINDIYVYYLKCNTNDLFWIKDSQNIDQEIIEINLDNECEYVYFIIV